MAKPEKISKAPKFKLTMLLHSLPGAGKTHLIGTASECPELGEILVIDLDGGKASLNGRETISLVEERTVDAVEQHLWNVVRKAPGYENVGTVVLDGASELAKAELAKISATAVSKGKREDQDKNEIQDYGLLKGRMLRLIRMARDIPNVNTLITSWTKATYPAGVQPTPEMQPTLLSPDFTRGVSDAIQGMVDVVAYIHHDRKSDKRTLVTQQYSNIVAKCRGEAFGKALGTTKDGKFTPTMEDPTFHKIVAAYKSAYVSVDKLTK